MMLIFFVNGSWINFIQAASSLALVLIALVALGTWKSQFRAQRRVAFIDELTDTVHAFILSMSSAIMALKFAKMHIDAYRSTPQPPGDTEPPEILFIQRDGAATARQIQQQLDSVRPTLSRMKSLVVKGQTYDIKNYCKCRSACSALEQAYGRVASFAAMIGDVNLNWNDTHVRQTLDLVLSVNDEEIAAALAKQNTNYLLFAKDAYEGL